MFAAYTGADRIFTIAFNQTVIRSVRVLSKTCECPSCILYSSPPQGWHLPSHCSHFSLSVKCNAGIGQYSSVGAQRANEPTLTPYFLPSCARLPAPSPSLSSCLHLPSPPTASPPSAALARWHWSASYQMSAKVMHARTFSSSWLSWQRDPWAEKTWGKS